MQLSGRSYIFVAATLLLLAGALKFYDDYARTPQGQARIFALKTKLCDAVSLESSNMRFGCHSNLITGGTGTVNIMPTGGGSTITFDR